MNSTSTYRIAYYALCLGAMLCLGTSHAQDITDAPLELKTVEITSRRVPKEVALTKTTLDSSQIAQTINLSLAELLSRHTPLFIKSYGLGSLATVSFRGTAASHTQVQWNGLNINNPMLGQVDFSMLPVWLLDNATLLHGGSSLQEGSGALGGSIILNSTPSWGKKIYGSAMAAMGSFGTWQGMAMVGGGTDKVQVRARYIYEQARNDFKFLNTAVPPFEYQKQTNADYRKHSATVDMNFKLAGNHYLDLNTWFNTADRNLPSIMSYEGLGRTEWQTDDEFRAALRWRWYGENLRSILSVGYTNNRLDYYLESKTELGSIVNYDTRSGAQTAQLKYTLEWDITSKTTIRTLVDANMDVVNTLDRKTNIGYRANREQVGINVSVHHRFNPIVAGYILLRYQTPAALMPSIGLEIEPLQNLIININGTRNYHRPTLNDLYWIPGGNPNLEPEKGITADISASYSYSPNRWKADVKLTGYLSRIQDWIIWQPSEYRYWTPQNVKTVLARGIELNTSVGYKARNLAINLSASYAFTKTTNQQETSLDDDSKGKQLIYIPLHKANMMLDVQYRFLYFFYNWTFTSERFTTSSNDLSRHSLPPYNLSDITLGARFHNFDIAAKINNLFNIDYQAILWRPMPRQNYSLLIKYSF